MPEKYKQVQYNECVITNIFLLLRKTQFGQIVIHPYVLLFITYKSICLKII